MKWEVARAWILVGLLALGADSAPAPCQAQSTPGSESPPNILLILSDDQRWDTIGALGNSEIHTPNLDRLVARGFTFNNAYCMGSMIGAVLSTKPYHADDWPFPMRIPTTPHPAQTPPGVHVLPTLLGQAGYATFHSGKSGNVCRFGNAASQLTLRQTAARPDPPSSMPTTRSHFLPSTNPGSRSSFTWLRRSRTTRDWHHRGLPGFTTPLS